jgi:arginase
VGREVSLAVGGVHLLGVPFNSKGRADGVALGPPALRDAGLVDALSAADVDITDRGDVELGGATTTRDPRSGLIDPAALVEMIRLVRAEVHAIREACAFPLVIGGDCPILLGCLGDRGRASPPGLLFVDGHEYAWPPAMSTTGEAADMELGLVLGVTLEGLPGSLASELPRLDPDRVVVIGPRDARELAEAGISSISDVVQVVRPDAVAVAGADRVGADAVSRLAQSGPWWFHVDLDVLSPDSLGAVDYRQQGGFDWDTLEVLTRRALGGPRLIGWDVTIYNPDLDPKRTDAKRIVRYLSEALGALGTHSG